MKQLLAVAVVAIASCLLAGSDAKAHAVYVAYDPCCLPPIAVTVCCAPAPAVVYHPVAIARTRSRPILGGTVTRVRYSYAPVVYTPGWQ